MSGSAERVPAAPRRLLRCGASYPILILALALSVFPLYWMFVVASSGSAAINSVPPRLVPGPNLGASADAVFARTTFGRALINSTIVSAVVAASQVLFSTMAGYAFAKLRFRFRNLLLTLVIVTMMVPTQLGLIPLLLLMSDLGWINTLRAVIAPSAVTAFGLFWMRQLIDGTVPDELIEAARIDGAGTFHIYRSIVLPLIRPGASVLGLFAFMTAWNDFLWPLVVLTRSENQTAQVALRQLQNQAYTTDFGVDMAGTLIATAPLLALFALLGRQIVGGVMDGAIR